MAVWGGGFCHGFSSVVVGMGAGRCGYRWHLKPPVGTPCHALSTRATTSYNPQKWVFTYIFEHLYLPIVNTAIATHQTGHHELCSALWLFVEVEFSFQMTGLCTLIIIFMLQICFCGYLHLNFNQPHSEPKWGGCVLFVLLLVEIFDVTRRWWPSRPVVHPFLDTMRRWWPPCHVVHTWEEGCHLIHPFYDTMRRWPPFCSSQFLLIYNVFINTYSLGLEENL